MYSSVSGRSIPLRASAVCGGLLQVLRRSTKSPLLRSLIHVSHHARRWRKQRSSDEEEMSSHGSSEPMRTMLGALYKVCCFHLKETLPVPVRFTHTHSTAVARPDILSLQTSISSTS